MSEVPLWLRLLPLAFALVPCAVAFGLVLLKYRRLRRIRDAERAALRSDVCLACGVDTLDTLATQVARCRACGFVGGPGIAALQRTRRLRALQQLAPRAKRALALDKLREAHLWLLTAQESMDEAVGQSVTDVVGLSPDRGAAKVESFALALRQMHTAHVLAVEGAEAAALHVELTAPEALLDSALLVALDSTPSSDTALGDIAMHMRIHSSRDQLRELRERVDGLLAKLTSGPA